MQNRFYSLDVFRGATVALMILVNNPGSWSHIFSPLEHAPWHGCTPTDLVFPFFLFAVGNAMAFVIPKLKTAGDTTFWKKVIKRSVLIFAIGLFLNWFPFVKYNAEGSLISKPFESLRIFGVLARIAVCYFFASIIVYYANLKWTIIWSAIILLGYWFLCYILNPSDPYSLQGWFGTSVDVKILGEAHMYKGEGVPFDPEGLMSTFTAVVQVILGFLVGKHILSKGKTAEMLNQLFVYGFVLIIVGLLWDLVFPLNKKLWTSSYVLYTTGIAVCVLSIMIYWIEFKNKTGTFTKFFDVFGKNALFIFVLSGLLPRLLALWRIPAGIKDDGTIKYLSPFNWFYENLCKPIIPSDPRIGSFVYALIFLIFMWSIAYLLDRRKIYIKV
jgi:predicted acyltransferase